MNKTFLIGRLTKDPETTYIQGDKSSKAKTTFTLAVKRSYANKDGETETDFIPVVLWNNVAELVGNHCAKGHKILVEGHMQVRSYDDKEGQKRFITEVIGERIEYIQKPFDE